jgi:hypothetical protein
MQISNIYGSHKIICLLFFWFHETKNKYSNKCNQKNVTQEKLLAKKTLTFLLLKKEIKKVSSHDWFFIFSFNSFLWFKSFDPYSSRSNSENLIIAKKFSLPFNASPKNLTPFSFLTYELLNKKKKLLNVIF